MKTLSVFPILAACMVTVGLGVYAAQAASISDHQPDSRTIAPPTALIRVADTNYCFARVRRLMPERQPPSYLVLRVKLQVAYRNTGSRALIMPVEHERTVYESLTTGVMDIFHELPGLQEYAPSLKIMKELPPKVSPDNPVDPRNDAFTVIPAHSDAISPVFEELTFPVNRKIIFRHDPDLRGRRLYLRLQLTQQEMTPALETDLSDRWTRFGTPWTGSMLTNVVTVDVPRQIYQASPCTDESFETPGNHSNDIGK